MKKRILFICTHNSARSQMAEGLVNALYGDRFEALSGRHGRRPASSRPPILVMAEIGIDISGHRAKKRRRVHEQNFDYIMTVCDNDQRDCPFFPGGKEYIHHALRGPGGLRGDGRGGPGLLPPEPGRDQEAGSKRPLVNAGN